MARNQRREVLDDGELTPDGELVSQAELVAPAVGRRLQSQDLQVGL